MKKLVGLLFLWFMSLSCISQVFDLYKGDTINRVDVNNMKQGKWIVFDAKKTAIRAEGKYLNNKKEGPWKKYYVNGNIQSEIVYSNNRTNGYAKLYYEDGNISEEGNWKGDKWVGKYKFYHKNGNPAHEWVYNEQGTRTGIQRYYYENGKIMIEGEWREGNKEGVVKEYFEDGSIKHEMVFTKGIYDESKSKTYTPKTNFTTSLVEETAVTNPDFFDATGYHKIFNLKKQLEQEGTFLNGKLMEGKRFIYDENGKLIRTHIYKNGKRLQTID